LTRQLGHWPVLVQIQAQARCALCSRLQHNAQGGCVTRHKPQCLGVWRGMCMDLWLTSPWFLSWQAGTLSPFLTLTPSSNLTASQILNTPAFISDRNLLPQACLNIHNQNGSHQGGSSSSLPHTQKTHPPHVVPHPALGRGVKRVVVEYGGQKYHD
jgi:hypothetical protein